MIQNKYQSIKKLTQLTGLVLMFWITVIQSSLCANAMVSITPATVDEAVKSHVHEVMKTWLNETSNSKVAIDVLRLPTKSLDFVDVDERDDVLIEVKSSLERNYSSRALVHIRITDKTGRRREVGVPVKLTVHAPIWVMKNNIIAGSPLKPSDFKLDVRDVSQVLTHIAGQKFPLGDYQARVNLKANDVLDTRRVIIPPEVKRNASVQIMLSNGKDMKVSVRGEALSDGRIGQTIRVRHRIGNNKPRYFMGEVVSKNRVKVTIGQL